MDFENKKQKNKILLLSYLIFWGGGRDGDGVKEGGKGEEYVTSGTRVQITNAVQYEFTGKESEEIVPDSGSVTDQMRNLGQLTSAIKGLT